MQKFGVYRSRAVAGLLLLLPLAAQAQDAPPTRYQPQTLGDQVISTLIFSVIGILVAVAGFKLFDAVIRFDLEREICERQNIAAAILAGAVILGICLIVGLVVLS